MQRRVQSGERLAGTGCAAMTAVSKHSEIPETEDMTNRRSTPPIEAIEATLEPPEDEAARPSPLRPDTVVINAADVQGGPGAGGAADGRGGNGAQYMMMRPDRQLPAYLLVCMGANVGHRYPIGTAELTIGRSDRSDIRIDDDRVSSRHAELVRRGGRYRIYDLGSSNGTLVNAQRVDEIDLRDGDLIQVGYTVFRYVSGDAVDTRPTHQPEPQYVPPPQQGMQVPPGAMPGQWQQGGQAAWHNPNWGPPGMPGGPQNVHVRAGDDDDVSFAEMVNQLRRLIAFFWPYRFAIAALAAVGFVGGAISAVAMPPRAAAFFDVRLHSKASENPLEKFESSNVEFFRSAATTFRSTGLIHKTLLSLGEQNPSAERLQSVQEALVFNNTGSDQNSQTYTGSFRGPTDAWSLDFLNKHVDLYLEGEIEKTLKIIRAQVEFLQNQLNDTEKTLRETEEKLLTFKKANIDGLPDQARQYYDYLFELQKKESDLAAEISRFDAEAAVDARRLQAESPMVESRSMTTRPYQQAIVDVNRQLAEARANGLADDHPDVRQLNTKLSELKRLASDAASGTDSTDVERSRNPIYDDTADRLQRLRASAAATRQEKERLRQDQARIKDIVDKLPKLEAEYADLTRSYDATKALHTKIFEQLKTAQLQYELEKASASARYEIITPPRLEYVSYLKNFVKRALLLMVVGIALGFALAVVLQMKKLLVPPKTT
jgi:uncharacterized protein involved in exopolysaccharide biosynthesis